MNNQRRLAYWWAWLPVVALAAMAIHLGGVSIDGLRLNDPLDRVLARCGQPEKIEDLGMQACCGYRMWEYRYAKKGLVLTIAQDEGQSRKYLLRVNVSAPATAKTNLGIGIGSTRDQVKKAYGKPDVENPESWTYRDSDCEGLIVGFQNDHVTSLFLGPFCE